MYSAMNAFKREPLGACFFLPLPCHVSAGKYLSYVDVGYEPEDARTLVGCFRWFLRTVFRVHNCLWGLVGFAQAPSFPSERFLGITAKLLSLLAPYKARPTLYIQ